MEGKAREIENLGASSKEHNIGCQELAVAEVADVEGSEGAAATGPSRTGSAPIEAHTKACPRVCANARVRVGGCDLECSQPMAALVEHAMPEHLTSGPPVNVAKVAMQSLGHDLCKSLGTNFGMTDTRNVPGTRKGPTHRSLAEARTPEPDRQDGMNGPSRQQAKQGHRTLITMPNRPDSILDFTQPVRHRQVSRSEPGLLPNPREPCRTQSECVNWPARHLQAMCSQVPRAEHPDHTQTVEPCSSLP